MDWADVLALVGPVAGVLVALVVRGVLRARRVDRALDTLARGGRASLACRARGDDPYPDTWQRCRLDLAADGAVLRPTDGGGPVRLPAGALELVHVRAAGHADEIRLREDDLVVVMLADGAGTALRLLVPDEQVEGVLELVEQAGDLAGGPRASLGPAPGPRWWTALPLWALGCALAGLLSGAAVVTAWVASEPVATVVRTAADADGLCAVTWTDPWDGRARNGGITCWDEQPGQVVPGLALASPARGAVFDTETFPMLAGLLVAPLLVAAGVGAGHRRWVRSRAAARPGAGARAGRADVPLPRVAPDDLDLASAADVAAARAVRERWEGDPDLRATSAAAVDALRGWQVPGVRAMVRVRAARAATSLVAVVAAAAAGWTAWDSWLGMAGEPTARAVADAGQTDGTVPFAPDDLWVSFVAPDAGRQETVVALLGDAPDGEVTVEYAVRDPQRARLVGDADGTGRGMLLSGLLLAAAAGWTGRSWQQGSREVRAVTAALRGTRRRVVDYVLVADPEGDPVLLLFEGPTAAPRWAVPLAEPVLSLVPHRGRVEVRGDLVDDGVAVPVLPDRVLWPAAPVAELDVETAVALVTGVLPEVEED